MLLKIKTFGWLKLLIDEVNAVGHPRNYLARFLD